MMIFKPTMPQNYCGPDNCPLYNTEWYTCNVTHNKCPKQWEDDNYEDHFDFPDDCPAKGGVLVKL